jgi:serine/threonine protein kinase
MKTLSKAVILQRNHVSMVMKERNLLARLHCPQLVNMHYAFQDARNLYIVMDVCLGGDLHYQLTHSPNKVFTEHQARFYCASILTCLEYMHSVGVIHRDVKPENLLLDSRGQVKVTDLGISMELQDGVCTSTSGTRPYMAPEIFMSGHKHTQLADFYSLGITAYQFLLGQRPYRPDTANMKAIVRMATFVPPEKYTDVRQIRRILMAAQERRATNSEFHYSKKLQRFSPEARDFVMQCLICNPRYRLGALGIGELMAHPWFAGVDWDAMRAQECAAPFLPDTRTVNCAISTEDLQQLLLSEEEAELGPEIPQPEQLKFAGYDYRTRAKDHFSGRGEGGSEAAGGAGARYGAGSSLASSATISVAPTESGVTIGTNPHLRGYASAGSVGSAAGGGGGSRGGGASGSPIEGAQGGAGQGQGPPARGSRSGSSSSSSSGAGGGGGTGGGTGTGGTGAGAGAGAGTGLPPHAPHSRVPSVPEHVGGGLAAPIPPPGPPPPGAIPVGHLASSSVSVSANAGRGIRAGSTGRPPEDAVVTSPARAGAATTHGTVILGTPGAAASGAAADIVSPPPGFAGGARALADDSGPQAVGDGPLFASPSSPPAPSAEPSADGGGGTAGGPR